MYRCSALLLAIWGNFVFSSSAVPIAINTNLHIRLVLDTATNGAANSVRIAKDPRDSTLYYLQSNGDIYRVNLLPGTDSTSARVYGASDHGLASSVLGMAIGPDGTIYVLGNTTTNSGNSTFARIMKGVPNAGGRVWSMLAQTEPYPLSRTAFDHLMSGMVVSADGLWLYVNSGSRTDHGEVETANGLYPDLRETGLTAKILRLPAGASNLILSNDLAVLRAGGFVFAEGTRNAFDLAFTAAGELFGTDNGPDRDMSDELNWIRPGMHYGFPWRMGGADNPQQFPSYNPAYDLLLDSRFVAVHAGAYHNDPLFPPPPTNFFEPVMNVGPDADSFRDPADGSIKDASNLGQALSTFTAHRSPLGLVFDNGGALALPFRQHGFVLGWTQGDPTDDSVAGPFMDPGQDMLDLDLSLVGTNYQARVTRIVGSFANPIDAEILANKIYVIEYSGNQGIWEIGFPPAPVALSAVRSGQQVILRWSAAGTLQKSTVLSSAASSWSTVDGAPNTSSGGSYTDSPGVTPTYYRLQQQW